MLKHANRESTFDIVPVSEGYDLLVTTCLTWGGAWR
jgi:hypothetical protein